jgi:Tol biopolymer transport system component
MTTEYDLERALVDWLGEAATPRELELSDVFAQTRMMHQRHAWASPAAWRTGRMTLPAFRVPGALPALIVLALTLAVLIVAAFVGSRPRLPSPIGPARPGLIAVEVDSDIHVVQPDGTGRRLLVGGAGAQFAPTWSPDGTRLAYWSGLDPKDESSLWVVDSDGSAAVEVTGGRTFYDGGAPTWAPNGKRLAFSTRGGELRVVNSDGGDLRRIGHPQMSFSLPTWSPDGSWIAVRVASDESTETGDRGTYRGYVIHPDGTGQTEISGPSMGGLAHMGFGWSPDGRSVIYHVGGPTDFDIAISRLDASGVWRQEVLLDRRNTDVLPAWSNDGAQLAFIRTEGLGTAAQVSHLMVATADGRDPRVISDRDVDRSLPCWSPDDRSVLVTTFSTEDLLPVVDLVRIDGSGEIEINAPGGAWGGCGWQRLAP